MATQAEFEAAKTFQYKTDALKRLLNDRDGFDPVNDKFHADIFKYAYKTGKHYNRIMVQYNGTPLGIEHKHTANDQYTMLTPDAAEPGRYRLSFFDKQGFYSHSTHDTIPQAVEEMVRDGFFTEQKGILSQLNDSPEFEIGNRVSTLIGQLNMGKITHQEFSDQRNAIHDEIRERMDVNKRLSSLIEKGADINQLLNDIVKYEKAPLLSSIANLLQNKHINASIVFDDSTNPDDDYFGLYKDGQPPRIILKHECGEYLSQVFLHECIHAVTYDAIRSGDKASNVYVKRLSEIKQHARKELTQKGIDPDKYYGLSRESHLEELITEVFTDPELRQVLQQVSSKAAKGTRYSNTIKTMYDDIVQIVNDILGGEEKHHPVIKELMEIGAGLMIVNDKYTGDSTMNMIINDRGETVPAVGNEISIARAKARWPNLIEETQTLFKKYPRDLETQLINQIAAQGIRNTYEAQAVLDAAVLPLIERQVIKEPRIVIDPEKYSAMFAPTKFNVGDPVTFINDYGVVFENRNISGIDKNYGKETRYFMEPNDAPWYSSREGLFTSLTLDQYIIANLELLFPEIKADQDGEIILDLVAPNGKGFYERLTMRPIIDNDILPANSFNIKHFTASPSTIGIGDPEHIKHEFTFSVKDNRIEPYWMQKGPIYHDALSHKSNGIYTSPDEMKHEMHKLVYNMLEKTKTLEASINPVHVAYIDDKNKIVGYMADNQSLTTDIDKARDVSNNRVCMLQVGKDLLKSPHALEAHNPLTPKLVQHFKKNKYISAISETGTLTNTKGASTMFIQDENSFDQFKAIALAVAQYRVDPKTGVPLDTYAELKKHNFTDAELTKHNYHAEALKLVDDAIAEGFKPNSYSLIQTIHEYAPIQFAKIRGNEYFDKDLENGKLRNGDTATGEVTVEGEKHLYKITDSKGNVYETEERPTALHHFTGDNEAFRALTETISYHTGDKVIITPDNLKALLSLDDNADNQAIVTRLSNNAIQGTITGYNPQSDTVSVKFDNEVKYNDGAELLIAHPSKHLTNLTQNTTPTFPALSPAERQELTDFTKIIKESYPTAKPENLHQLCTIASDMKKLVIQNDRGTLSDEKFNTLTDTLEAKTKELTKDLPHVLRTYMYIATEPAIKLHIARGQTCNVPEIPKNKLTVPQEPKAAETLCTAQKR